MFKRKILTAGLLMAAATTASAAPYGFFDARSVAMGNVSVATGNLTTAALSNPAMMSVNESDDSFALLIPAVGIQAVDSGGIGDLIDDYQDQLANATASAQAVTDINAVLTQLDLPNTFVGLNANVSTVLGFSGDDYSVAFSYRAAVEATARVNVTTFASTVGPTAPAGTLDALGVGIQEIGISLATEFSLLGMDVSVGVTPKSVQVDLVTLTSNLDTIDVADVADDTVETDLGSFTTFDAGVALQLSDSLTLGLVAKNIMEETVTDGTNTFNFDKHLRAGVSYHNDFLTIAADMDLTEIDPPVTLNGNFAVGNPSKVGALGVEFDLGDIVQLRAGYQTNLANGATDPDLLSVGVGLWLGFHLDIAAVVGDDSSFGAFVQTGFRF
jgi:F plasmid transfer operon, TraF, protein